MMPSLESCAPRMQFACVRVLLAVCLGAALCGGLPCRAGNERPFPAAAAPCVHDFEDAQSTTGPFPPQGLLEEGASQPSPESAVVLAAVPAYIWHHGCGPTAAGMVIGYWDGLGLDFLVPGNAATQTAEVNTMMATEGPASNYSDYCVPEDSSPNLRADLSEPPPRDEHVDNCVADYMRTSRSVNGNYYGWSWASDVGPAMTAYADSRGHAECVATAETYYIRSNLTFARYRGEIDAGRPMVFLVDTDASGGTDHFVAAIGYDDTPGAERYACLNTWDTGVHWYDFKPMQSGQSWGIYCGTTFLIDCSCSITADAGPDVPLVCPGDEVPADGSASVVQGCVSPVEYRWLDGASVICDWQPSAQCLFHPAATTTYTLEVRCQGAPACAGSDDMIVRVAPPPAAPVGANPRLLCLGGSAELGGGPGDPGLTYAWNPPDDLSDPSAANPVFTAVRTGTVTYTLTVTDPGTGCASRASLSIEVRDLPPARVGPSPRELCMNQTAELGEGPGAPGFVYAWSPADHLSDPGIANPVFTAEALGTATYTLGVTDAATGCNAQSALEINVIAGVPSGPVGNSLMVEKAGSDLTLSWGLLDVRHYNVHWAQDESAIDRASYAAPLLSPVTGTEQYVHAGAGQAPEPFVLYQVFGRDCDGQTILP